MVVKGKVKDYLFVMLMLSHSHRVTSGHSEFHLPISFPLSYASEVFLQGLIILNGIYVPLHGKLSVARRTVGMMLPAKLFIKIRDKIGPKTDPWGTPDNTGTGLGT